MLKQSRTSEQKNKTERLAQIDSLPAFYRRTEAQIKALMENGTDERRGLGKIDADMAVASEQLQRAEQAQKVMEMREAQKILGDETLPDEDIDIAKERSRSARSRFKEVQREAMQHYQATIDHNERVAYGTEETVDQAQEERGLVDPQSTKTMFMNLSGLLAGMDKETRERMGVTDEILHNPEAMARAVADGKIDFGRNRLLETSLRDFSNLYFAESDAQVSSQHFKKLAAAQKIRELSASGIPSDIANMPQEELEQLAGDKGDIMSRMDALRSERTGTEAMIRDLERMLPDENAP